MTSYLKNHGIRFSVGQDDGTLLLTMVFQVENAPNHEIESCVWTYDADEMEIRTYYDSVGQMICRNSEDKDQLFRLLNYINARVFLRCADYRSRLYEPYMLYTPRIYLTEDNCFDITITTIIPYDFFELAPIETADYMTIFCPSLLDELSVPSLKCFWEIGIPRRPFHTLSGHFWRSSETRRQRIGPYSARDIHGFLKSFQERRPTEEEYAILRTLGCVHISESMEREK